MYKRPNRKNIHKFLGSQPSPSDALSSHAYGKVAKQRPVPPRTQRSATTRRGVVPGYRDSMVGSITQYRDTTPPSPKTSNTNKSASQDESIIGNRPKNGAAIDKKNADARSIDRRKNFIEPPRRNFNPYS